MSVLLGVHVRASADQAPTSSQLALYLQSNSLDPGIVALNGYDQVYYRYNNQAIVLTTDSYNHLGANSSGEYIAWQGLFNGGSQIYLYDMLTGTETQLTTVGTNEDPFVYQNTVTWQSWDGAHWQVMYYDGNQVWQLSADPDYSSTYASTDGKTVIYTTEISPDDWEAEQYDIATKQTSLISEGPQATTAFPHYTSDGSVSTAYVPR